MPCPNAAVSTAPSAYPPTHTPHAPHLQERSTLALSEDTEEWLIDWNDLHRSKIIGEGAFGKVRRPGAASTLPPAWPRMQRACRSPCC